jgi:Flp pilus assembly protein TadG
MGTRLARRLRQRQQRGAAAVEFALIILPMSILLFGILQYSFFFFSGQSGANAAREAARRAAVGDQTCAELSANVTAGTKLRSSTVTVTRKYYAPTVNPITDTSTARAAGAIKSGDNVRVVITYQTVDMHFPIIPVPKTSSGVRLQIREVAVARLETVTAKSVTC